MDPHTVFQTVARRLGCDERHAEAMTFIVLQILRERLTTTAAAHVAAQLPSGSKALWQARERLHRPVERIGRKEFIDRVRRWSLEPDVARTERAVMGVLGALQELLGMAAERR